MRDTDAGSRDLALSDDLHGEPFADLLACPFEIASIPEFHHTGHGALKPV